MKRFGLLAVAVALSALSTTFYSGQSAAMPITLAFEGTIIEPLTVPDERVYVSGGGIFAPGQAVTGSVRYDPSSVTQSLNVGGAVVHNGVVPSASFLVSAAGGPYETSFPDGLVFASCSGPSADCSSPRPEDIYALIGGVIISTNPPPIVQPVNGLSLSSYALGALGENILVSNALLSAAELVSLFDRSPEFLFTLTFIGDLICDGQICVRDTASVQAKVTRIAIVHEPATAGLVLLGIAFMARGRKARQ